MNLQDLASLAEIVGGFAVLATLVYLVVELRDNTRATRSASASEATSITVAAYTALTGSTETSGVWYRGMTDPSLLSEEEKVQFILLAHTAMIAFQNTYYLSKEGSLDVEMQSSITENLLSTKNQPGFELYWSQRRLLFMSEFRDYVDELIQSSVTSSASTLWGIEDSTPDT
jgi:hypothetical protein